jgi:hypothetical protein
MTIIGVQYAKNGEAVVVASENTSARVTNLSELSLMELLEGLIDACDKEIVSKNATKNA